MKVLVYTDGSSRGNPGAGAYAFLVKTERGIYEDAKYFDNVTNNQMELLAILNAIKFIKDKKFNEVLLKSDSEYAVKGINMWMKGWKKNGWKTAAKKEVKNQDIWVAIDKELEDLKDVNVKFEHVYGHNGEKYNERVDFLCTSTALKEKFEFVKDF